MSAADVFAILEEGDHVLFNERKVPLTVETVHGEYTLVVGPQGGEYDVYPAQDDETVILVSRHGDRQYASKVTDLRKTGRWEEMAENTWKHSKTRVNIGLEKNELGMWAITCTHPDSAEIDVPHYGYTKKDVALEDIERFMRNHPEG